jgi:hypothetical protein
MPTIADGENIASVFPHEANARIVEALHPTDKGHGPGIWNRRS